MLVRDPRSYLHAAIAGWKHPVSFDWIVTADLYDLTNAKGAKRRPKPYPRPWTDKATKKLGGKKNRARSNREVLAILRPPS